MVWLAGSSHFFSFFTAPAVRYSVIAHRRSGQKSSRIIFPRITSWDPSPPLSLHHLHLQMVATSGARGWWGRGIIGIAIALGCTVYAEPSFGSRFDEIRSAQPKSRRPILCSKGNLPTQPPRLIVGVILTAELLLDLGRAVSTAGRAVARG